MKDGNKVGRRVGEDVGEREGADVGIGKQDALIPPCDWYPVWHAMQLPFEK